MKIEKILHHITKLDLENESIWEDIYGRTAIKLGEKIIENILEELLRAGNGILIITPALQSRFDKYLRVGNKEQNKAHINQIISIGGAKEHNIAKKIVKTNITSLTKFITIPFPLSNDSFCTNRYSPEFEKIEKASHESFFPTDIIVDLELLRQVKDNSNISGVGEYAGLYFSMRDYYSARKLKSPSELLENLELNFRKLIYYITSNKASWLKQLAVCLLEKCLIMRANKNHQIGAGADHLLAYVIERMIAYKKLKHGKLVYLGSLMTAALFPEWEQGIFSLKEMMQIGIKIGLVDLEDIRLIIKLMKKEIMKMATKIRPNRLTELAKVDEKRIKKGTDKLKNVLYKELS